MDEKENFDVNASEEITNEAPAEEPKGEELKPEGEALTDEELSKEEKKEEVQETEEEKAEEEVPAENKEEISETKEEEENAEASGEEGEGEKAKQETSEAKEEEEEAGEPEVKDDEIATRLAEAEAKLAEIEEEKAFNKKVAEAQQQTDYVIKTFSDFRISLGKDLEAEFKRYNIDTKKSINELREEDPAKAALAINLTNQAMSLIQDAENQCKKIINDNVAGLIFNKASRKFAKFEATPEQMKLACDTFVDIFKSVGIGNMSSQLDKAVELSIARAKFLLPEKAEKARDEDISTLNEVDDNNKNDDVVKDNEVAVVEEKDKETKEEQEKKAETKKEEGNNNNVKVEPVDAEAFEEGTAGKASVSNPDGVTAENVIEKYLATPYKERVAFYKKYYNLMKL